MKVKYISKGKKEKQCKDCKYFKPKGKSKGLCFGHEVLSIGSCNFFKKK